MTQTTQPLWPCVERPRVIPLLSWRLTAVGELPRIRAELRAHPATAPAPAGTVPADAHDQLLLALDEMASNALRHGGGTVHAVVGVDERGFLVEVSDSSPGSPPTPAVDRDPCDGGLGLYLIAEMALAHGWCAEGGTKHVWAVLPRS